MSPSSVRRVLAAQGLDLHPPPRPGTLGAQALPRVGRVPARTRSGSTTPRTSPRAKSCVTVVEDLVSRKWIADIVSLGGDLHPGRDRLHRRPRRRGPPRAGRGQSRRHRSTRPSTTRRRPILLAVSDNGPQMTSGSTREFMALCAIAQHFGRPGTPTDQAWIESFNGHLKAENPHLEAHHRPGRAAGRARRHPPALERRPAPRRDRLRHARRRARRTRARHPQGPRSRARIGTSPTARLPSKSAPAATRPGTPRCRLIEPGSLSRSQKHVSSVERHRSPGGRTGRNC